MSDKSERGRRRALTFSRKPTPVAGPRAGLEGHADPLAGAPAWSGANWWAHESGLAGQEIAFYQAVVDAMLKAFNREDISKVGGGHFLCLFDAATASKR